MPTATEAYRTCASRSQRDEYIMSHTWLVRHIVGRVAARLPAGVDLENLEAAGVLGLIEAANKFDHSRGIKFKTFAYTRVRGAVLDELRRNCPLPQHVLENVTKIRRATEKLHPGPVTPEGLAKESGLPLDTVLDALAAMRVTETVSWDDSNPALSSRHRDHSAAPDEVAQEEERKERLAAAIAALPERERIVVSLYYLEDLRLREIGEVLNLSESRISRLLSAALFRLRERMEAAGA